MRSRSLKDESGFSLLELLVALVILGVITAQLFVTLSAQQRAYRDTTRGLDIQDTARNVLDVIVYDTRNAGVLVPREAAVSSIDGGNAAPDRLCVSDGTIFQIPAPGTSTFWDNLGDRFPGAIVNGGGGTNLQLDGFDMDTQPPVDVHFNVGSGAIIATANGQRTHCAKVTSVTGTGPFNLGIDVAAGFAELNAIVVPAVLYEIINPATPATRALQRNGITISTNVEDLQVEFWVDNLAGGPNGRVDDDEFPIHDLNSMGVNLDTARIRRVRISVVGITDLPDEQQPGASLYRYPGAGNRLADAPGAGDAFKRKLFISSVLPRNLLNPGEIQDVP